jgi:nucleoid-associated protein YgaU
MAQQLRKSITALAFFLVSVGLWAQPAKPPSEPLALKPDAPERYVVVPGDTLWGISGRYTDSPWRWPELWGLNREQIQNPHLIYPGYVILLDRARGRLTIGAPGAPASGATPPADTTSAGPASGATPGATPPASTAATAPGVVRLSPRARGQNIAKEMIPSIPAGAIEPFLTRPLVVEPDGLDKAPSIVGTQADRVVLSEGNVAYVRGIGASKEGTWYVYRRGDALVDPDTNQTLAYEAIYLGTAEMRRPGDPAMVVLTSAVQEVSPGDKLVAAGNIQPINYAPHAPSVFVKGRVMSIYGGISKVGEAGPQSVITINRGRADGIEIGHVLALYSLGGQVRDVSKSSRDAMIQLPDERAGLAFVFRVFDRVSYALVMNITRPISPLDVVQTP